MRDLRMLQRNRTRSRSVRPWERETIKAGSVGGLVMSAVPIMRSTVVPSSAWGDNEIMFSEEKEQAAQHQCKDIPMYLHDFAKYFSSYECLFLLNYQCKQPFVKNPNDVILFLTEDCVIDEGSEPTGVLQVPNM